MSTLKLPLDAAYTSGGISFRVYSFEPNILPCEKLTSEFPHMHHNPEFFYIYDGMLSILTQGDRSDITVSGDELCIVPSGFYHRALSNGCDRLCFELSAGGKRSVLAPICGAFAALKEPLVIRSDYITVLMNTYKSSTSEAERAAILLAVSMHAMSKAAPLTAMTHVRADTQSDRRWIIEQYISTCFTKNDGIGGLAKELCLTERRTSEVVRELMGKGYKELIVEERMTVAKLLIDGGRHTLEEIAETVGYSSYSGFYTAYKSYYGMPPMRSVKLPPRHEPVER